MRILLLTAEYPPQPGGVGDYTRRLGLALAEHVQSVEVLTIQDGRWTCLDLAAHTTRTLGAAEASWGWRSWRGVIEVLAQVRPDVLHIQYQTGAYGMHPAINLLPWRISSLAHRPAVVVTFHDLLEPYLLPKAGPLRRWVTARLARDADAVIATNQRDGDALSQKTRRRSLPVAVIPIGANIPVAPPDDFVRETWRVRMGVRSTDLLVGYFGLLGRSKGADLLLHALEHEPAWRLVIIGGAATAPHDRAYAAAFAAQVAQRGLNGRVIRTGQVHEAAVSAHLLAADVVSLPFRDGASFRRGSLLAALSHGCAVVTTVPQRDTAAPTDSAALQDGINALLVPPDDSSATYHALKRLAGDRSLRVRLGAGAQTLAAQFDWGAIAERHIALYHTLS